MRWTTTIRDPGLGIRDPAKLRIPDPGSRVPLPYPMDDAALHHVFDGGWMWVLRFGNGVTSAGVAVEDWLAEELKLAEGEPAWARLLARYPSIAAQFAERPSDQVVYVDAEAGLSRGGSGRRAMGDVAVCGRVHRSVVLDRHSAHAARD